MSDNNNQIDSLTVGVGLDSSDFKRGQREIDAGLEQLEQSADDAAHSVDNLGDKAGEAGNALNDLGGQSGNATKGVEGLGQSADNTSDSVEDLGDAAKDTAESVDDMGDAAGGAANDIEELGEASQTAADKIQDLQDQINELQEDAEDAADELADLQDELDNLNQSSGKTGRMVGSHFDQVTRSVRGLANEVMGLMALNKMAGGGYGNAAGQAIEKDTAINRQAESIGIAPSRLNAWGNATELEGGTAEEGRNFLQRINDAFVGHTIDARQIPELLLKNVNSRNPDGSQRAVNDMAIDTLDVLFNKADERQRSLIIRDFFGGGAGLTRLAGMGHAGVEQALLKAEHRANLSNQDFQNIDQFSRALREARQNVEGFGNGLLSWTAKVFGPFLENLNKNHPELVGAGGAALSVGVPLAGMAVLRKWLPGARAAGAGAGAGAGAAEIAGGGALTGAAVAGIATAGLFLPGNFFEDKIESDDELIKNIGDIDDDGTPITRHVSRPNDTSWNSIPLQRRKDIIAQLDKYAAQGLDVEQQIRTLPTIAEQQAVTDHYRRILWSKTGGQSELENQREFDRQLKAAAQPKPLEAPATTPPTPQANTTTTIAPHSFEEMQQRIVYQESRGQDYWRSGKKKGQPVVSVAGARYSRQVMPATAHDPGFGIPAARDESPEEYNRVGDALMKALYSYYNGDTDKAMAAYHSGMGRVNKLVANAGRNGTDWRQGLGPKGRAYIGFDPQQVPQHLLSMNDPANYPGVQQAMIRNDNRRITNTTHIDTLQVTTAGGSPEAMARGAQSALQRHPLALNGSDYA